MEPHELSIHEAGRMFRRGTLSPVEMIQTLLERVERFDPQVKAFVTVTGELARRQAARAERALRADRDGRRPLLGIPIVLKDLIETAGIPTTASSRVLEGNMPDRDAAVWRRLRRAGAVLVGKTHTHEFAFGSSTPPTRNPWDTRRIPGGSSGGSAAALAAGFCLGAVGTDTAGSIRIPAGLCGVVGLKPTYGLVSKAGVIPLSWSLDHVGPMARSPQDAALLLQAMAGFDPADPASVRKRGRAGSGPAGRTRLRGLRVGVIAHTRPMTPGVRAGLAAAMAALERAGARLDEVEIEAFEAAVDFDFTTIGVEAALYHRDWIRTRRHLYSGEVGDRIAAGFEIGGVAYLEARRAAEAYRTRFREALAGRDLLLSPGMPIPAPTAYVQTVKIGGREEDTDRSLCRNTAVHDLTGFPALALPAGFSKGLPVGVQLIGRPFDEARVLGTGEALSRLLGVPTLAGL